MNQEEFGSRKLLKLKYRSGDQITQDILQNWFHLEIRSPIFNLQKFENPERITPESYKMH